MQRINLKVSSMAAKDDAGCTEPFLWKGSVLGNRHDGMVKAAVDALFL